jgi:hypothetical protein
MARVGKPVQPTSVTGASFRPDGRIGAPPSLQHWASLEIDTRVEVPAPQLFVGLSEVSSFGAVTEEGAAPTAYRITAPRAALRAGPALREREIGRLNIGQRVEVMTSFDREWLYVRLLDGKSEGYVHETELEPAN